MNIRRKPWQRDGRRGTTTVEMALAAPVFFLIVFALIEFSRMAMLQHAMTTVAREGCRRASLATVADPSSVETWMRQQLKAAVPQAEDETIVDISLSPSSLAGIPSGTIVSATITVPFAEVSWIPPRFLTNSPLTATASAKRE